MVIHDPVIHHRVIHDPAIHDPVIHDPVIHEVPCGIALYDKVSKFILADENLLFSEARKVRTKNKSKTISSSPCAHLPVLVRTSCFDPPVLVVFFISRQSTNLYQLATWGNGWRLGTSDHSWGSRADHIPTVSGTAGAKPSQKYPPGTATQLVNTGKHVLKKEHIKPPVKQNMPEGCINNMFKQ